MPLPAGPFGALSLMRRRTRADEHAASPAASEPGPYALTGNDPSSACAPHLRNAAPDSSCPALTKPTAVRSSHLLQQPSHELVITLDPELLARRHGHLINDRGGVGVLVGVDPDGRARRCLPAWPCVDSLPGRRCDGRSRPAARQDGDGTHPTSLGWSGSSIRPAAPVPGRSQQQWADKSAHDTTRVSHSKSHAHRHRSSGVPLGGVGSRATMA
jgi:hypothetical protein